MKKLISEVLLVFFSLALIAGSLTESRAETLNSRDVIYQVLVDRFYDGDKTNNDLGYGDYNPADLGFYHGGDWKGLCNKLDYIADLGVTAIWISPVSKQEPLSKDKKEASYHGYFTKYFATPNEHFGSKEDLAELIRQAHKRNLKMILDIVPNHTSDYLDDKATRYQSEYKPAYPLDNPSYYHHAGGCRFDNTETQDEIENCDLGGLDDLDQNNPAVSDYLINTYKDWIDMGFDGVRVDAARSIPKPWLQKLEKSLGVPSFGEIFVGDVDYVADYQNYQWGALDFPYFFTVREAFSADTDMRALAKLFAQDYKYKNPNHLETFIDNHDRARFLTWANDDYQRLRAALAFLMTSRGVPVIYYGTEQADDGNGNGSEIPIANKDNRKDMSSFSENSTIYRHIKRLNAIRKDHSAVQDGKQLEMWVDPDVYAFARINSEKTDETITISHNKWGNVSRTIPLRAESNLAIGSKLTNLLNTEEKIVVESGGMTGKQIKVELKEHETKILALNSTLAAYEPEKRNLTTIRIHTRLQYGQTLVLRGDTYPLSWQAGRACRNIDANTWEFTMERIPYGQKFKFKVLVDDKDETQSCEYTAVGGQNNEITIKK